MIVYYPRNQLMFVRDTISASYEQVALSVNPNTVLYMDSGSGLNAISNSYLFLTASRSDTASWAENAINGGTNLTTGSTYPITASWSVSASYAPVAASGTTLQTGSTYPITASVAISASYAPSVSSGGGSFNANSGEVMFIAPDTWSVVAGITTIKVILIGAGGGGNSGGTTYGGGGGGYVEGFVNVVGTSSLNIEVGLGGFTKTTTGSKGGDTRVGNIIAGGGAPGSNISNTNGTGGGGSGSIVVIGGSGDPDNGAFPGRNPTIPLYTTNPVIGSTYGGMGGKAAQFGQNGLAYIQY